MEIDFSIVLKNLKGKPLKTIDNKEEVVMDLAFVSSTSLLAEFPDEPNKPKENGRSKQVRANLAKKVFHGGIVEVTAEEITKIKDHIAKCYGALIVAESYDILEGAKTPSETTSTKDDAVETGP